MFFFGVKILTKASSRAVLTIDFIPKKYLKKKIIKKPWKVPSFFPWREIETESHNFSAISDATFLLIKWSLNFERIGIISSSWRIYLKIKININN